MIRTLALPHGLLTFDDVGPHAAETTLVLLHGFPHDHMVWIEQLRAQPAAFTDTRVIALDLPGFGASTPPVKPTLDAYADAIAALLDSLPPTRVVLGGLSMGGYITFACWRRFSHRIAALILAGTKATADTDAARQNRVDLIARVRAEGVGNAVAGLLTGQLGKTTRTTNAPLVEQVDVMLRRAPASGVTNAAAAMRDRIDSSSTLETIAVPTLIIVGDEDVLTPVSDAIAMAAAIGNSRLVTIAGAGHLAPLEQPMTTNAAIAEFLDVAVTGARTNESGIE
jgi:3-oxoadipate enol-lactonase